MLKKGDVIYVNCRLYKHYGIFNTPQSVIHFAPRGASKTKEDAVIQETTLEKFADGSPVSIIEFQPDASLPADEIISRARSRLGEDGYNFFTNNCEHFARWCATGKSESKQVTKAFIITEIIAAGIVAGVGIKMHYDAAKESGETQA
jgi:hypothetical protein